MLISRIKSKGITTSMNSPRGTPSRSRFGAVTKPASHVRVVVRVRPFLQAELTANMACTEMHRPPGARSLVPPEICVCPSVCSEIIRGADGNDIFQIFDAKTSRVEAYKLDACYGEKDRDTADIFAAEMDDIIQKVLGGENATVFAQGATGSGKTYTMKGTDKQPGLMPLTVERILLEANQSNKKVEISYYHVYLERCYDLLQPKVAEFFVLEDSSGRTQLKGLTQVHVTSIAEFHRLFADGCARRRVGPNDVSSRSHAVLSVMVTMEDEANPTQLLTSKLNLVDLAGHESGRRTGTDGVRVAESAAIKQSLFMLSNVIVALNANETRVPYRDSKLTRILQDSLGSNSSATIIACLSPGSYQEASATLGVAARSRQIHSRVLRQEDHDTEIGEKVDADAKLRPWRDSRPKTPGKSVLPALSPLRQVTPVHLRSCPESPSVKSVKRTLAADPNFSTPRARPQLEKAETKFRKVKATSTELGEHVGKVSKILDFGQRMPMDCQENDTIATSEKPFVECSGSLVVPDENIFHTPLIQYDNPMYQEDSPPLSARLKSLETNMRALSPLSTNVEPVQSRPGVSPVKFNIGYVINVDTSSTYVTVDCPTPVHGMILQEQGPDSQTPEPGSAQALTSDSGSLTPFQQFKHKNPDLQMTLVKQYLTVLNTASKEELLQLKGIGPKRAADILDLRMDCEEPFKELQDLKNIGLSERQDHDDCEQIFERLKTSSKDTLLKCVYSKLLFCTPKALNTRKCDSIRRCHTLDIKSVVKNLHLSN